MIPISLLRGQFDSRTVVQTGTKACKWRTYRCAIHPRYITIYECEATNAYTYIYRARCTPDYARVRFLRGLRIWVGHGVIVYNDRPSDRYIDPLHGLAETNERRASRIYIHTRHMYSDFYFRRNVWREIIMSRERHRRHLNRWGRWYSVRTHREHHFPPVYSANWSNLWMGETIKRATARRVHSRGRAIIPHAERAFMTPKE